MKSKKRKVEDEYEDGNPCDKVTDILHTQSIETPPTSTSQKRKGHIGSYFMPRTTPDAQPTLKSVMQNGWTDRSTQTLINFLVYCPKEIVFIKSVDASHASKTADLFFKLFKEVVMYVGLENIVHIVTDNAANYVAVGRLLEKEFPHLFWSPCAADCVNLMFQDIEKSPQVTNTVSHAAKITKYLYNQCHPLYLMRQFTNGKEIFPQLQLALPVTLLHCNILAQKDALRALVTSREWTSSAYTKDVKAKKMRGTSVRFKLVETIC
ncbi:hypothetical protein Lal_00012250 [Lupinus albus]|nr:hypothetical protein Lal_00012250 [Lupinus albus]